jgi:dinuclear metal center YbgI/SA1388 family protein
VPKLAEVIAALEGWYDPTWAEPWDAVGLVCGDPADNADDVLLAVDAVPATVTEAIEVNAQLLLTHHPLLLTPVHGVPATEPKGTMVHRMVRARMAHYVAHTNADVAEPGVSDALAYRIGLDNLRPLDAQPSEPVDKLVVFVPVDDTQRLIHALASAGAGVLGRYEQCAWTTDGLGTFRPRQGATPAIGRAGAIEQVAETRVEMVVPSAGREGVIRALRAAHPYEEPAFDLYHRVPLAGRRGTGRVGELEQEVTLGKFVELVAAALPATAWGVRAAGDPARPVRTVAVCGGSGASLIEDARRVGADAFLTADLKHHSTSEAVAERDAGAMALLDAAHWATEAPWLQLVAGQLRQRFDRTGLRVTVSAQRTDPWTLHVPSPESSPPTP